MLLQWEWELSDEQCQHMKPRGTRQNRRQQEGLACKSQLQSANCTLDPADNVKAHDFSKVHSQIKNRLKIWRTTKLLRSRPCAWSWVRRLVLSTTAPLAFHLLSKVAFLLVLAQLTGNKGRVAGRHAQKSSFAAGPHEGLSKTELTPSVRPPQILTRRRSTRASRTSRWWRHWCRCPAMARRAQFMNIAPMLTAAAFIS